MAVPPAPAAFASTGNPILLGIFPVRLPVSAGTVGTYQHVPFFTFNHEHKIATHGALRFGNIIGLINRRIFFYAVYQFFCVHADIRDKFSIILLTAGNLR